MTVGASETAAPVGQWGRSEMTEPTPRTGENGWRAPEELHSPLDATERGDQPPMRDSLTPANGSDKRAGIRAIPTTYSGVTFRSGLEADWAATFDHLGWYWQYEPEGILVNGQPYLPDFYLPAQRVFCEVKGPHNERMDKTTALARALATVDPDDPRPEGWQIVVVLRPAGRSDGADWHSVDGSLLHIGRCPECDHYGFADLSGDWRCRRCSEPVRPRQWVDLFRPASVADERSTLPFSRAPRKKGAA